MDGIKVRDARLSDLEEINRIYNHEVRNGTATWEDEPWTMAKRREWFAEHGPTTPVLVAEIDGRIAGFAYLSLYRPKAGYRHTREDTIYIDPGFRGRGVGSKLLSVLVERARLAGIHCLVGVITADNTVSLHLHRQQGFAVTGTVREAGRKFGRWLDASTVQLLLPGPDRPD